ncbi:hypothetical protein FA13DRAFT_1729039, partial [Coprinellus micaceus]
MHTRHPRIRVRDRSQLLANTPPPGSGRSSPFGGGSGAYANGTNANANANAQFQNSRYVDDLEGQNDEAIDMLSSKVRLLKDVSEWFDYVWGGMGAHGERRFLVR